MRKISEKFGKKDMFSMLLFGLASIFGGGAMAAVIGDEGPDANTSSNPGTAADASNSNSSLDPAHPDANDRVTPGGGVAGQDLTGTQASATQVRKGDLAEDEWDNEIIQFRPWNSPFAALVRKVSKTIHTNGYERKHMRVGGETLEVTTTAAIGSTGSSNKPTTVVLKNTGSSANVTGSLRPFYKGSKIYCLGISGYKNGSATETEGILTLIVTETNRSFSEVTCMALNGPAVTAGESNVTDELDCRFVPAIASGTVLAAGAVSMGESQLLVTPENYQPREKTVYLQKKGFNIVWTDDFEKISKKQPLKVQDIKADTIQKYNLRAERDYFLGTKQRWNTTNEDGSVEYAYSSEGAINQITNSMAVDNGYSLPILTAISMLQFTEFSAHNTAYAFCGKNAMRDLLNMTLPEGRVQVFEDVSQFNIDFKRFKTTFGTIDFVHCISLDMLHMEDCIVVLDLAGLVRYVYKAQKDQTNDLSKGTGEIREAKRFIRTEADCIALRGYNSILIGPSEKIYNLNLGGNSNEIIYADAFPASPADGTKVALAQDVTVSGTTYYAGVVYVYSSESTSWSEYNGTDNA